MAQEDVASKEEMILEQESINFQTFFFEALQQKAIENYDKAIYALEACYNMDAQNIAVLFELSKNYTLLNKYTEAEFYILKGLELEPNNIFMLNHLILVKSKQNNHEDAIEIYKRIVALDPDKESELVVMYIKAGKIQEAIDLLKKLDNEGRLPRTLQPLKSSLTDHDKEVSYQKTVSSITPRLDKLKEDFSLKNDFNSLKQVLDRELKTKQFLELQKDSEEGIALFPAQPYVYYMQGVALNQLRKYQKAIPILETGLDYLVDDEPLQAKIFEQLGLSYKGLGENKKASQYYNKSRALKEKK